MMDTNYRSIGMSQALEESRARRKRSQFVVIGSVIAIVGVIVVAVVVGVTLAKKNSQSSSSKHGNSAEGSNPNDPSSFPQNSNLFRSFYGLAYTPANSQYPACGNSLDAVIQDIQVMSQLTPRIHLYGADCNQSSLVLEAIQQTKVNMSVYLANYVMPNQDDIFVRQMSEINQAVQTYGTKNVAGCIVGNEFMLDYLTANGAMDPNGPVGQAGGALLLSYINQTKGNFTSLGVNVPVGTSDAGSYFNNQVLENVDFAMSNIHGWFANQTINNAATWVTNFFETTNVQPGASLTPSPKFMIGETGWPTNSSDVSNETNGASNASVADLQIFLDTFVCQCNQQNISYFFFEYMDEPWQGKQFGGVEGYWGLFMANGTMKNLNIPNCTVS